MESNLSTKIRACATISSISIIYIHNSFVDQGGAVANPHDLPINYIVQSFLAEGVARWGLPFFWIMSGFLYFRTFELTSVTYYRKIKNRFKSLFIPYLIWSGLGIVYYFIIQTFIFPGYDFSRETISELSLFELINVWLFNPTTYQLWFLRDLFLLVVISPVLYLLIKYLHLGFILVILMLFVTSTEIFWPYQRTLGIMGFCLGGLLAMKSYAFRASKKVDLAILILWLLLLTINTWKIYTGNTQFVFAISFKVSRMLGVYLLWVGYDYLQLDRILQENKWMMKFIYFSFFLYLFHEPFLTSLRQFVFLIIPLNEITGLLIFFSLPWIVYITAFFVRKIMKKFTPGFYGLITGNR